MMTDVSATDLRSIDRHHLHPFTDHGLLRREGVRIISRGEGAYIYDSDGNAILDGMAGLWCVNIGYGREELARVAYEQMRELAYYNTFFKSTTAPATLLAQRLVELSPSSLDHVFFGASGSESNDTAIRTIRYYWQLCGKPDKQIIISRESAYHGSTVAAASMSGMKAMHDQLGSPVPGFVHVMCPYSFEHKKKSESDDEFGLRAAGEIEKAILRVGAEKVAAFVGEPIQGAGGVRIPPRTYWKEVQRICKKYDILLHLDEVITGFGRTGSWFAAQRMKIKPDLMTVAKALTSGYQPLSALLVSSKIATKISKGGEYHHGYTYSGHPVACAVALENLRIIESEGLIERVRSDTGDYLLSRLRETLSDCPIVSEVRGYGFLFAIEVVEERRGNKRFDEGVFAGTLVRELCILEGLVMRAIGDTMILSPPLIWTRSTIDEACEIISRAFSRATEQLLKRQVKQ